MLFVLTTKSANTKGGKDEVLAIFSLWLFLGLKACPMANWPSVGGGYIQSGKWYQISKIYFSESCRDGKN